MSDGTRSWIEIGSVLALVGGLALVAAQIKQSTDITRIQLATSVTQSWRAVDATRQSEEFAKVLAKSIEQPQDLTLAEFLELDAYYVGVLDQLEVLASHLESGYRESSLETLLRTMPSYILGTHSPRHGHSDTSAQVPLAMRNG